MTTPRAGSRSGRAVRTYAAGLLLAAATMTASLAATPFLKRWLGDARFGAVRTLAELNGHLGLLELGLGSALAPLLARALGRQDERALAQTLAAGVWTYARIAALVLAAGLALTGPLVWLIRLDPGHESELRWAWVLGLAGWGGLVLNPFRTLTEAENQGYRVQLVLLVQTLAVTALTLLGAWAGWGLVGQTVPLALGGLLGPLAIAALAVAARPTLPQAILHQPVPTEVRQALWHVGWPTVLFRLSGQISLMTDYLVLSALRGAALVTPLYLTQRLAVLAQQQIQNVGAAAWAALVELHHQGEHERFNRRLVELTGLVSLLAIAALGPIVAYNRHFVALWVGPDADAGDLVVLLAAANAWLQGLFSLWTYAVVGVGQVRLLVLPALAGAAVNLTASIALTHRLGLIGPLLGTTLGFLAVNAWFLPWLLWRTFGVPPRALLGACARVAAFGLPAAATLWLGARFHQPAGWPGLAAEMTAAALALLLGVGRLTLDPPHRALWLARLQNALPKINIR
jgi:O-antigen/teichoic acid export membrane protein